MITLAFSWAFDLFILFYFVYIDSARAITSMATLELFYYILMSWAVNNQGGISFLMAKKWNGTI